MAGVAVKVTDVAAHTVVEGLAEIVTDGRPTGFTVMIMTLEVATVEVTQVLFTVTTHQTWSPFVRMLAV